MSDLNRMMEQVKKIKNGIGVQAILDEAYRILGNPIAMNNTEYALLAYTEVETDDPIWHELITLGTFGEVTQKFFEKAGFIEEVANNRIAYLSTPYLKYDRINGKLLSKNNTHISNLVIVACNKPFEDGDQLVFDIICKIMSSEIGSNEEFAWYEQLHQELLIKNLIDGNYDVKMDMAQVEILYGTLASNLYLAVVDLTHCNIKRCAVFFRDMFKRNKPEYKYAIYEGNVVFIISTDEDTLNVAADLKELIKIFEQYNLYAGISGKFENMFEIKKFYAAAILSKDTVMRCRCNSRIFPYCESSVTTLQQLENLENGGGVQFLLNKGAEILGNPLLFHDMELNLLGYTQDMEIIDPIWTEIITYGTASNDTVNLFKTEDFVLTMENTKGGALLVSEKIKYDRISWRVYSKDSIMIGCLSIVNTCSPFSKDSLVLFGILSEKFSREVSRVDYYNKYGRVYSESVINRLVSGKIDDFMFYSEDIGNLYSHLLENLYCLVIDTSRCVRAGLGVAYFRMLFDWREGINRYAIHSDNIIIIISTKKSLEQSNEFEKIEKLFLENNIYAGISSRFENIYETQHYYAEAINALKEGMKQEGNQRIFVCGKKE